MTKMLWLFCFIFNVFLIHPVVYLQSVLSVAVPSCSPRLACYPVLLPVVCHLQAPELALAPCPTLCSSWHHFRTRGQEPGSWLLRHLMTLTCPHLGYKLGSRHFHLEFWRPSHSSLDCVDFFNYSLMNPTPCPGKVLGPICIYLFL